MTIGHMTNYRPQVFIWLPSNLSNTIQSYPYMLLFPRFGPHYAKSVAFKIHSIEIEDQSHHWLPVVYLHEDTKGHLLSRWIAEKKTDCLIFSSSFWSLSPQSHFYFHVWKHHHFSHVNDLSFLYHQKNHCHIGHHTIQARLSHRSIMLSDHIMTVQKHDSHHRHLIKVVIFSLRRWPWQVEL